MSYQSEKNTEHIGSKYLCNLLNIDNYSTSGNRKLFQNKIPDGWILKDNNLLIIEYKQCSKDKRSGYEQLLNYCKLSKINNLNIYYFLGIGTESQNFEKYFYKFIDDLQVIQESEIKKIFSNVKQTIDPQRIHNMIVNNFHFEKAEELHDILLIIVSSIISEDFKEYYEKKIDFLDSNFIDRLINHVETQISDSVNSYKHIIESIKKSKFKNSYEICKLIYDQYKLDPNFISKLFQQFKKYNKYIGSNNEIWTPPVIAHFMFRISTKYFKQSKVLRELNVLDPCLGFNQLIHPFIKHCSENDIKLIVKGCELSSRAYFMGKIDLLNRKVIDLFTYHEDFMNIDPIKIQSDISVNNPPYTMNISNQYDCLDFVIKSCDCAKISINIFPKARLIKNVKLNQKFLESYKLLEVIELGDNIFKKVSTGNIVIVVATKLNEHNIDLKTKYYDLREFSKEYRSIPHKNENILTDKGKQILIDYLNNKSKYIEYKPTSENMVPKQDMNLTQIKDNLIEQYEKCLLYLNSLILLDDGSKNIFRNRIQTSILNIQNSESIVDIFKLKFGSVNFSKVRLMDYFELIKFKSIQSNYNVSGIYPLIAAKKINNGIVKYIDKYSIDTKNQEYITLVKNGDGGCGTCFIHSGKIALSSSVYLLKPIQKLDLKMNVILMTLQLTNMGFGFSNAINQTKLNNIELYLSL